MTDSSFSVKDLKTAKAFYSEILELKVDAEDYGLRLHVPGGHTVFVYPKEDHKPATFTVLNFIVDTIDEAVDELISRDVKLERYEGFNQDEKGIARGISAKKGPDIAWFKDPSGNIFSIMQTE